MRPQTNDMKELPTRKKIRLEGYDYSDVGCYFITFCVKDKHEMLGEVVGANSVRPCENSLYPCKAELSDIGVVADTAIRKIEAIYPNVEVNKYVVMPNHIHMVLVIDDANGCNGRTMCAPTISRVIKQCKEYVTKQIGFSIWQRSYHDRIIRDEAEYQEIWRYIDENPAKWSQDCYFVEKPPIISRGEQPAQPKNLPANPQTSPANEHTVIGNPK